jgi:diguanylate cyclase (GGDEF)-like protein
VVVAGVRRPLTRIGLTVAGGGLAVWVGTGAKMDVGLEVAALIAAAGAAIACLWTARRAELTRPTWQFFAAGCLAWFLGALVDAAGPESSTVGRDAGAMVFAVAGVVGLTRLVRRCHRRPYQREETVGALLAGVATLAAGFEFLIRPIAHQTAATADRGAHRVDLGLQAATIGLVIPLAIALAIGIGGLRHRLLLLILTGCLAPAVAVALTGSRVAPAERGLAGPVAVGWWTGFALLAAAALLAGREPEGPAATEPSEVGAYLRRVGWIACVCALAVTAAAADASLRPGTEWVVVLSAVGCGVLISARMSSAGAIADRLIQRTRERDRLAAALGLSTAIAGTLDVDRLVPALAAAAAQSVDRTRAEITLIASDGRVERRHHHGLTDEEQSVLAGASAGLAPALSRPPAAPTVWTVGDSALPAPTAAAYRAAGKRRVLVVPLQADGYTIGTVELWTPHDERPFGEEDFVAAAAIGREGGMAIHNARLLASARARADERTMLLRVTQAATSSLDLRTVLAEIAQASLGVAGAECCTILLWHPETNEFAIGADQTIPDWPGVEEPGSRFPVQPGGSDMLVMTARQARRFDRASPDLPAAERDEMREQGTESILVIPLIAGDSCLGTLNLLSRERGAFDANAARLGEEIAAQTALAIQHARLLEETRRYAEEQRALLRVSRAVSSGLRLWDVLGEVARASLGIAGAEGCEIELWHQELDEIELIAQQYIPDWLDSKTNIGTHFPLADWPLTRRVLETREPLIFDKANTELTEYEREHLFDDGTQSGFAVPILLDDRCLGVFSLYSRQPAAFSPRVVALGRDLAGQAALAIERAHLHAALEARARTDGLTGVLNRGAIEEALDTELSRARRSGLPLAVLVVDLDGFKHVNDRHGHLAGDRVLQQVAAILTNGVRESDHVGRYGGDEFLVLLPDADETGAHAAIARIRAAMEAARVPVETEDEPLPIQFSVGHAIYPDDGSTHEELIAVADEAMYAAKLAPALALDRTGTAGTRHRPTSKNVVFGYNIA